MPYGALVAGAVVGASVPAVWLLQRAEAGTLGADPIREVLHQSGLAALILLVASLACSPLQRLTGWTWPVRLRKTLGLGAFFYASIHLFVYVALDAGFDPALLLDIGAKPFVLVGFLSWLVMVPLAWTSSRYALRRMGFRRWKALHRLAYLAGILGAAHFVMHEKSPQDSVVFAVVLGVLLLARLVPRSRRRATSAASS